MGNCAAWIWVFEEASFILHKARVHPLLPYGIMGINALIAAVVCMTGPETFNKPTEEVLVKVKYAATSTDEDKEEKTEDKIALFNSTV